MPFPMKIQPIDSDSPIGSLRIDSAKPAGKSRLKRLLERQFPSVLRNSSTEKLADQQSEQVESGTRASTKNKDDSGSCGSDSEPNSVCLAKLVQNFFEENEKQAKCGRSRCNCFNGNCSDSSDEEFELADSPALEACEILKNLVPCCSVTERNLLADTAKMVDTANQEKNKICRRKEDCTNACIRRIVTDGLLALGYDASICKSRWDQSSSHPAGDHEYIDVITEGSNGIQERVLIDIDFKSEFEIARSTGHYRAVLQSLPMIFVGKADRLHQIVTVVSEAAKQSLKKKGLHLPPWRKSEYMRAKWLSPYKRTTTIVAATTNLEQEQEEQKEQEPEQEIAEKPSSATEPEMKKPEVALIETKDSGWGLKFSGGFEVKFRESPSRDSGTGSSSLQGSNQDDQISVVVTPWQPPTVKPKSSQKGGKIVTGLASVLRENPKP